MNEQILNFDEPREKQLFLQTARAWTGKMRVLWCKHRNRRSDRQNRMYWPCVVQPFADFLRGQGEAYTDEQCHELLKHKFLRTTVIHKETGEIIGDVTRSTTQLDTTEFYDYVEKCVAWLAYTFHIECPSPDPFRKDELCTSRTE